MISSAALQPLTTSGTPSPARTKETKKDGWAGDRGFNLLSFTRLKIFQIHWKIGSLTPNPAEA
jgi:hypothetical protein